MKLEEYVLFNQLYDLYGALLTQRQSEVVRLHICEDLSLFEIAERMEISRQAVSDAISSAKIKLEVYEEKLHIISRTEKFQSLLRELKSMTEADERMQKIMDEMTEIWKTDSEEE